MWNRLKLAIFAGVALVPTDGAQAVYPWDARPAVQLASPLVALGFDWGNSRLYGISIQADGTEVIGPIDTKTGAFQNDQGQLKTLQSSIPEFYAGAMLAPDPINKALYLSTTEGFKSIALAPESTPLGFSYLSPVYAVGFDFLSSQMMAVTESSVVSVPTSPSSAAVTFLDSPSVAFPIGAMSAVDPHKHKFYVVQPSLSGDLLDEIDENSGKVRKLKLSNPLLGIAHDGQKLLGLAVGGLQTLYVVNIDPATDPAQLTIITAIDSDLTFPVGGLSGIDSNDRMFFVREEKGLQKLVIADIATARSWYVDSFIHQSTCPAFSEIELWLYTAGFKLGQHNKNATGSGPVEAILDYGQQHGPLTLTTPLCGESYAATAFAGGRSNLWMPLSSVAKTASAFARGFLNGLQENRTRQLRLVIGTNNKVSEKVNEVNSDNGRHWHAAVTSAADQVDVFDALGQILVKGGNDLEMDFSLPNDALNWVGGYRGDDTIADFTDFGDASGCPECNNFWTQKNVVDAAGNHIIAEIYDWSRFPDGQARAWRGLNRVSIEKTGEPLKIAGALTQVNVCLTQPCVGPFKNAESSPAWSFMQLKAVLPTQEIESGSALGHRPKSAAVSSLKTMVLNLSCPDHRPFLTTTPMKVDLHRAIHPAPQSECRIRQAARPLLPLAKRRQADHERFLSSARLRQRGARLIPATELGIYTEAEVPGVVGDFNGWTGYLDGIPYDIAAGYAFSNPRQGLFFILQGTGEFPEEFVAPVPAGPIEITSVRKGVVTLRTRPGDLPYVEEGSRKFLNVTHSTVFRFDIRRRRFIK